MNAKKRDAFIQRRFYTQKLLHIDTFTHRRFHTETFFTHTQTFFHTHTFTHRPFYTHILFYTQTLLHIKVYTHRSLYTQTLLQTDIFTHRPFYTQTRLHAEALTSRRFSTQTLWLTFLHTDPFTHRHVYTQKLLHLDAFPHSRRAAVLQLSQGWPRIFLKAIQNQPQKTAESKVAHSSMSSPKGPLKPMQPTPSRCVVATALKSQQRVKGFSSLLTIGTSCAYRAPARTWLSNRCVCGPWSWELKTETTSIYSWHLWSL